MTIDQVKIDRLIEHLKNQRALLASLNEGYAKDLVQAEINGIELSLMVLGIKVS